MNPSLRPNRLQNIRQETEELDSVKGSTEYDNSSVKHHDEFQDVKYPSLML